MKRIKTYQQLFESSKFEGTRFGHNQYQDFIEYIRGWEKQTGQRVHWGLQQNRMWDSYIKPGDEFYVLPLPSDGGRDRLVGILIDKGLEVKMAFDNRDRVVDKSTVQKLVKDFDAGTETVESEIIELVNDLSLSITDFGYEVASSWNVKTFIEKGFWIHINSKFKESLAEGKDFADLVEQLTIYLQDTKYSLNRVAYTCWFEEYKIEFNLSKKSSTDPLIFGIDGYEMKNLHMYFQLAKEKDEEIKKILPKGDFNLLDHLVEFNKPISKFSLFFESKINTK